jgi:nucleoid-associated protein YgaU
MSEPTYEVHKSGGSNAFSQKLGPLPLWGWMGIGLAIALVFYFWQKNKASSGQGASTSTETGTTEPANQVPPYIIQNYESDVNAQTVGATTTTVNPPPSIPPGTPVQPGGPIAGKTPPGQPVQPGGLIKGKTPPPAKKGQDFTTVTVVPWTATNTPWDSTLSGIASHYDVAGGYEALAKLNSISNPNLIYPGQKIRVPIKAK